ncbi:MAG: 3-oxoacyl-ACP reductase FabG [Eubacteriaceae bacterium]|nr:3-oxoacyl-ACP reductase FabG [Eubacteriaceae bacterium]
MLKGKVALVTGASRGIGAEIAVEMARNGAAIALNYYRDEENAFITQKRIIEEGADCKIYECDVSDFAKSSQMAIDAQKDYGRIDILVNNAGIARDNPVLRISEQDYDDVLDVNLKGAFNMIKHLYPSFMKNRSGAIINIASVCGLRGWEWQSTYAASKGGLIALTKSIAKELGGRGVTCNAIAPGLIETDMTAKLKGGQRERLVASIPMKRPGQAGDVSKLAAFLASSGASYITGEVIKVDGGLCI